MRYTQNIKLPIVEDNDLYSKEINNLAFEKIDEEIQGLADIVETLDSPENSIADIKKDINDINEQWYTNTNYIKDISVNVKMFGAKGDGITDDTEAIKLSLDYMSKNNLLVLHLTKTYRITNLIKISFQKRQNKNLLSKIRQVKQNIVSCL